MKTIEVMAARTQEEVLEGQCEVVETHCQTVAEAKRRAKYMLSDAYQLAGEASEPMRYSQVVVNGECVADFFRE